MCQYRTKSENCYCSERLLTETDRPVFTETVRLAPIWSWSVNRRCYSSSENGAEGCRCLPLYYAPHFAYWFNQGGVDCRCESISVVEGDNCRPWRDVSPQTPPATATTSALITISAPEPVAEPEQNRQSNRASSCRLLLTNPPMKLYRFRDRHKSGLVFIVLCRSLYCEDIICEGGGRLLL